MGWLRATESPRIAALELTLGFTLDSCIFLARVRIRPSFCRVTDAILAVQEVLGAECVQPSRVVQ